MRELSSVAPIRVALLISTLVALFASAAASDPPKGTAPFVAVKDDPAFTLPRIVVQHDPATQTGFDFAEASTKYTYEGSDAARLRDAVVYLREGVRRMTGRELEVISGNDLSSGVVLTTLAAAPPAVRDDPEV